MEYAKILKACQNSGWRTRYGVHVEGQSTCSKKSFEKIGKSARQKRPQNSIEGLMLPFDTLLRAEMQGMHLISALKSLAAAV